MSVAQMESLFLALIHKQTVFERTLNSRQYGQPFDDRVFWYRVKGRRQDPWVCLHHRIPSRFDGGAKLISGLSGCCKRARLLNRSLFPWVRFLASEAGGLVLMNHCTWR